MEKEVEVGKARGRFEHTGSRNNEKSLLFIFLFFAIQKRFIFQERILALESDEESNRGNERDLYVHGHECTMTPWERKYLNASNASQLEW